MCEIKQTLGEINSRLDIAEEIINKLEGRAIKTIKNEMQSEGKMSKGSRLSLNCGDSPRGQIYTTEITKGQQRPKNM